MSSAPPTINTPDSSGWSATQYNTHAALVYSSKFTAAIIDILAAQPGEKIIDFGCGSGELALTIAQTAPERGRARHCVRLQREHGAPLSPTHSLGVNES